MLAQLGVEGAERLVEQQHLRLQDECPGEGDPLLLAAGQLRRPALLEPAEADQLDRLADPPRRSALSTCSPSRRQRSP